MAKKQGPFQKARGTEARYTRELKKVAKQIATIVKKFNIQDIRKYLPLRDALKKYSEALKPWAESRAELMLAEVNREDHRAWKTATREMSASLRHEVKNTPIGARFQELMNEQVKLIQSIPLEAAQRVHELVIKNVEQQNRPATFEKEIARTGEVAASRAKVIARTEVSRAATILTQARAEFIGSDGYIWRTARDADVRASHRKMEGKFVKWKSPPTLDGLTGHAGALPNCRCYPEPVIPEDLT